MESKWFKSHQWSRLLCQQTLLWPYESTEADDAYVQEFGKRQTINDSTKYKGILWASTEMQFWSLARNRFHATWQYVPLKKIADNFWSPPPKGWLAQEAGYKCSFAQTAVYLKLNSLCKLFTKFVVCFDLVVTSRWFNTFLHVRRDVR